MKHILEKLAGYKGEASDELGHYLARGKKLYSGGHQAQYRFIAEWLDGQCREILDVGHGIGFGAEALNGEHYYTGIDPDPKCFEHVKQLKVKRSAFICCDWLEYDLKSVFDVVLCIEVMEHIDGRHWVEFLLKLKNATKSLLVISTPDSSRHEHGALPQNQMHQLLKDVTRMNVVCCPFQWTTTYLLSH